MDNSVCSILKHSSLAELLKTAKLIIWDECSAQHCFAFKAVNRTLCDLWDNNEIFGGITTVLGGDFLQTLPVVKMNLWSPVVHACLLSSLLWPVIKSNVIKLEKNMRVGLGDDNQVFAIWLRQLAAGVINSEDQTVDLPKSILCPTGLIAVLIAHVYPQIACPQPPSYFQERCLLAPQNTEVSEINKEVLDLFPGEEYHLWVINHALDLETLLEDDTNYSLEVLHTFTPSGFPVAQLILKLGCPVMILRNLQPREGMCNGSRGIVTQISTRILEVHLFSSQTVLVPCIKLISADLAFKLCHLQFSVPLSFSMTINKSQGQTFELVGVDLRHPVFTHGQLYVVLSRAHHLSSLKCIMSDRDQPERTKNIMFKEIII